MAQQEVDSKVGDLASSKSEAGLSCEEKPVVVAVKKTPLRDLRSENNIVAQKGRSDPFVLKEGAAAQVSKLSSGKRPFPDSPMSPPHQSSSNSGANGHLVYVRRKCEAEAGKSNSSEVITNNTHSPLPSRFEHHEDGVRPKSFLIETQMQPLPAYATIPGSVTSDPPGKPFIPFSLVNTNTKLGFEESKTQAVPSASTLPVDTRLKKQNWEERYVELQMYLKKLDQSSLEDHIQLLRSFSAVELSRHAVELEKQAIQLSLEQGKELQRVKVLNVLGKSFKTSK